MKSSYIFGFCIIFLLCIFSNFPSLNEPKIFITDYSTGIEEAQESNLPVCLIFTDKQCSSSKSLDSLLNINIELTKTLSKDFVTIYLNVKDRTSLSSSYITYWNNEEITVNTQGEQWSDLLFTKFEIRTTPTIIFLNSKEELLNEPLCYKAFLNNYESIISNILKS